MLDARNILEPVLLGVFHLQVRPPIVAYGALGLDVRTSLKGVDCCMPGTLGHRTLVIVEIKSRDGRGRA